MALGIDTRRALRGIAQLQALVEAVVAAGPHDEADWIEWKSALDLGTKAAAFHLARAILGLANRSPESARRTCEGVGYVVVGASPGAVAGVASVDHAELERSVNAYVGGARGPSWTPTWVSLDEVTTLVITVEPPLPGDQVWPLRREFIGGNHRGRVFVRKHGRTDVADDADVDALSRRAADRSTDRPDLDVVVEVGGPLRWLDLEHAVDAIDAYAESTAAGLLRRAEERDRVLREEDDRPLTGLSPIERVGIAGELARIQRQMSDLNTLAGFGLAPEPDDRSLEDFRAEVDRWVTRWKTAADEDLPRRVLDAHPNVVRFAILNESGRFLSDVELRIDFEQEWLTGYGGPPPRAWMPAAPREWGKPKPSPVASWQVPMPRIAMGDLRVDPPRRSWIEDGSVHVVFDVGDLRPDAGDTTDDFNFLLTGRPEDGFLRGTWSATMRGLDDVVRGTVEIPVEEKPIDVAALVEAGADAD